MSKPLEHSEVDNVCKTCGNTAPDWDGKGNCITCTRNEVLGNPLETPGDDITLCTNCNCMTHTIDGKCGKCDAAKVETPSEPTYTLKQLSILIRYALDLSLLVKMTLPQHEEHVKETVAVIERLIAEEVRRARIDKVTKLQIAYSIHRYYAKSSIIPSSSDLILYFL